MIDRNDDLPVSRQAKVLGISRGSVYYLPRAVSADALALMRRIDELHLDYPFAGSRMLQTFLAREGYEVGRLHVATLMKRMGIEAIYRQPNTSKPAPGHTIFPYLPAQAAGDAAQSGLGDGYHVYPHGAGLRLSCGRRRLVQPEGSGMEVIDYTGNGVLSGGGRGGSCPIWQRLRRLARQHLRRAPVADHQIRGGVPTGLRQCPGGTGLHRPIYRRLLQCQKAPFEP